MEWLGDNLCIAGRFKYSIDNSREIEKAYLTPQIA